MGSRRKVTGCTSRPMTRSFVTAWPGAVLLLAGMTGGRLLGETAIGCLVAYAAIVPLLARTHGGAGALAGTAVVVPLLAKRLAGNQPPPRGNRPRVLMFRLVLDRDQKEAAA